jgi:lipopolysaccharide transport system ATP-binding protein
MKASGPVSEVIDAYLEDVNRQERERIEATREQTDDESAPVEEYARRRGTRELEIVDVQLLDAAGAERPVFRTGEPLTIRMHYMAHEPIEGPVFGVGLYHESGFWLAGPNTGFDNFPIPRVDGPGYVDYKVTQLPLLTGRYDLSVAAVDSTQTHAFDVHDRRYQLVVHAEGVGQRFGVFNFPGEWAWEG